MGYFNESTDDLAYVNKRGDLVLPPRRQQAIVQPVVLQFRKDVPIGVIADKLRDSGFDNEAEWLIKHPGYVSEVHRSWWKLPKIIVTSTV